MKRFSPFSHPSRQGYVVIVLLVVVVIIMILVLKGPMETNPTTHVTQAQTYIDRSADVACGSNRSALATDLMQMRINNNGAAISTDMLLKFSNKQCPKGGFYMIGRDGKIYCTKHFPPPADELQEFMRTHPAAQPTPADPAAALPALPPVTK